MRIEDRASGIGGMFDVRVEDKPWLSEAKPRIGRTSHHEERGGTEAQRVFTYFDLEIERRDF